MNRCLFCENPISAFMTFGRMPLASGFLLPEDFGDEYYYELKPALCDACKLFQIVDVPDNKRVFHSGYTHVTSTSAFMIQHLKHLAQDVIQEYLVDEDPFVVEIGSNDGSLLTNFVQAGIRVLGIEPARAVAEMARNAGVKTTIKYFNEEMAVEVKKQAGPADIIFGINVIAHISDINATGEGIKTLLKDNGVFIFEAVYLKDIVVNNAYSQIYDEHVFNYSVTSVKNIFSKYGLELFNINNINTQGGSMRFYLAPTGSREVKSSVDDQIKKEERIHLHDESTLDFFRIGCEQSRDRFRALIFDLKNQKKHIGGYGAATKSTIMINYCQFTAQDIDYLIDSTPLKQNRASPGAHIPVKTPAYFRAHYPDYMIIFPWNHAEEIRSKEKDFETQGGQWIIPDKDLIVVGQNGETKWI